MKNKMQLLIGIAALSLAMVFGSMGCKTNELAAGGAYNQNPTGTNGTDSALPDVGFYLVDSAFDLGETTLDAALKIEANNRAFYFKLNPVIKHSLDSIRPQAWKAIGQYTAARADYTATHSTNSLAVMQAANNQISTLSAEATSLVTTTNAIVSQ